MIQHTATRCKISHTNGICINDLHAAKHCNTLQHSTIPRTRMAYASMLYILQHITHNTHAWHMHQRLAHRNTLRHNATQYNTIQHAATRCNTLQHTATHCDTMPHAATRCNILQHTPTHCNTHEGIRIYDSALRLLNDRVMCCSVCIIVSCVCKWLCLGLRVCVCM